MQGLASSALAWIGFCIFIILMLAIDLGVFNRRPHEIGYKNAALWSAVWVTLAGIFAALLFGPLGGELFGPARHQKALEFITGYVIELSLSDWREHWRVWEFFPHRAGRRVLERQGGRGECAF